LTSIPHQFIIVSSCISVVNSVKFSQLFTNFFSIYYQGHMDSTKTTHLQQLTAGNDINIHVWSMGASAEAQLSTL